MEKENTSFESIPDTGKHKECSSVTNVNNETNDNVTSACLHKKRKKRVLLMSGKRSSRAKQKKISQDSCLNEDQRNKDKTLLKQFEKTNGINFKVVKVTLKRQDTFAVLDLHGVDGNAAKKHKLKPAEPKPKRLKRQFFTDLALKKEEGVWERCQEQVKEISRLLDFKTAVRIDCIDDLMNKVMYSIQANLSFLYNWLGKMSQNQFKSATCRYFNKIKQDVLKLLQWSDSQLTKDDDLIKTQEKVIDCLLLTLKLVSERVLMKIFARNEGTTEELRQYTVVLEGTTSFSDIEAPWDYLISKMYEIQLWKNEKEHNYCALLNTELNERNERNHALTSKFQNKTEVWNNKNTVKLCDSGYLQSTHDSVQRHCSHMGSNDGEPLDLDYTETFRECSKSVDEIYAVITNVTTPSKKSTHQAAMRKAQYMVMCSLSSLKTCLEICINEPEERRRRTKSHFLDLVKAEVLHVMQDEDNCIPTDDDWLETQERILDFLLNTMNAVYESVLVKVFRICEETSKYLNLCINILKGRASCLDIDRPWEYLISKLYEIKRWKNYGKSCTLVRIAELKNATTCSGQLTRESGEKQECVAEKENGFCLKEKSVFEKLQEKFHKNSTGDLRKKEIAECQLCIKQIENDLDFSIFSQKSLYIKIMKEVEFSVKKALVYTNEWLELLKFRLGKKKQDGKLDVQCKTLEVLKTEVLALLKEGDLHMPKDDDWMETQERILECLLTAMTFVHELVFVKVCNVNKETEKTLHLYTDVWDRTTSFSDIERPWEYLISKLHEIHLWKLAREKSEIFKVKLQNNLGAQTHEDTTVTDKESDCVSKNRDSADASSKKTTAKLNENSLSFNFNTPDALLNKKTNSSEDVDKVEKVNNLLMIVKNTERSPSLGIRQYKDSTNNTQNRTFDVARASVQTEAEKKHCKGQDSNESPNTSIEGFKGGKLHETHIFRKERKRKFQILKMKSDANTNQVTIVTDKESYCVSENEVVSCIEKNAGFQQNRTVKQLMTFTWNDPTSREKIAKLDDSTSSRYIDGADASPKKVTTNAGDNALITYVEGIVASSNKETDKTNENPSSCLVRKYENNDNRIENTGIIESVKNTQYRFHQLRRSKGSENSSNERTSGMDLAGISVQTDLVSEDGRVCTAVNSFAKNGDSGIVKQIDELHTVTRVKGIADTSEKMSTGFKGATKRILSDREKLSRAMKGHTFDTDVDCLVKDPLSQGVVYSCLAYIKHIKVNCKTDFILDKSRYSGECKRVYSVLNRHLSALSHFLIYQVETVKKYSFLPHLKSGVMTVLNDADKRIRNNDSWIDTQKHILDCLFCTLKDVYEHVLIKVFYVKEVTQKMISFYFGVCKGIITLLGGGISSDFLLAKYNRIQFWQAVRKLTETNIPECPGLAGPSESRNQDNEQECRETMPVSYRCALNGMSTVLQDLKEEHELADELVTVMEEPVENELAVVQNPNLVVRRSEQMVDVMKETEDVDFVKDIKQQPLADVKQSGYVEVMSEDSRRSTTREATDFSKKTLSSESRNQDNEQESRKTMPVSYRCVLDDISAVLQDIKKEHGLADEVVTVKEEPVEDKIASVPNQNLVVRPSEQMVDVKKETEDVDIVKDIEQEPLADVKQSGYVDVMYEDSTKKEPFFVTFNQDWVNSVKSPVKTENS